MKLTKEEALAYVRGLEEENRVLKNRCLAFSGGALCLLCSMNCKNRKGAKDGKAQGAETEVREG